MGEMVLAAIGDCNDRRTWSGIPWHLLQEGRRQGLIAEGLALEIDSPSWKRRRLTWNIFEALRGHGIGGYQYSAPFLEKLWAPVRGRLSGRTVVNCFPLFPPSIVTDEQVQLWFFIDQTLLQLFDTYGIRDAIGRGIAADAVLRERTGYKRAECIVVHSCWAADSVINDYGIGPEKVVVIVPGANLEAGPYADWEAQQGDGRRAPARTLRLVFVGKHPQRKGLDRLLRALALARAQGADCTLRVIGCQPGEVAPPLRTIPGVEWAGYIDKTRDARRYLELVAECDVGCLLSRAEAGGIGLREYHALGLAVLGPDVGGSPDHALDGAAMLVRPDVGDDSIAQTLHELCRHPERVEAMRQVSWARRKELLWGEAVRKLAVARARIKAGASKVEGKGLI